MKYLLLILLLLGCTKRIETKDYLKINYEKLDGKEVIFPEKLRKLNESLGHYNFKSKRLKLLFISKMNCSPCIIRMKEIQNFYEESGRIKDKIDFIFIGVGENTSYFNHQVKENTFSYHIYSDSNFKFIDKNDFYNFKNATMLLDKENRVVMVGDIINNKIFKNIYMNLIDDKKN